MLMICCGFVATKEGVSLAPYQDLGGVWTICHGETVGVTRYSKKETPESCSIMLQAKLMVIGWQVWSLVHVPMSDSQWAALTSFAYNVGIGAFQKSTLLKRINAKDPKACDAFMSWTYVPAPRGQVDDLRDGRNDGKKNCALPNLKKPCNGIVTRRTEERALCMKE